jgi:hypothetical protein
MASPPPVDPTTLLLTDTVLAAPVRDLHRRHDLTDDVPNIQFAPLSIEYEISPLSNPVAYSDYKSFHTTFGPEIELMSRVDSLLDQGTQFVHMLYCFRSVSKAIPVVVSYSLVLYEAL